MTKEITAALCKFIQQVGTIKEEANAGLTVERTLDKSANLPYCAVSFSSIVPTCFMNLHKAAVISFVKAS